MPIQFRRGTDAQRTAVTPAAGEPIWVTDTDELYVGDGSTPGGVVVTGGGGGGGAPTNASYLVLGTNASLSAERVLVVSTGLSSTDAGANGNLTIALATHAASFIGSGTVALARGGLAADISTTGGAGFVLKQTSAGAAVSVAAIAATDLPTHNHVASNITSGTLALAIGGLAADISTTGGSRNFLKQTSAGSAVSVSALAATELGTSGSPGTDTFLRGDLTWQTLSGGGGGGAPTDASYLVIATNTNLSQERAIVIGTGLSSTDGGANGNLTIALASHTHAAGDIQSGTLALARGGLAADISATGPGFLRQTSAGSAVSVAVIAATDLPTHNHVASNITSGTLALSVGGLAADLSATGGTAQFLKQSTVGGAITVATIAATEVGTSGTPSTSTFLRGDMTWSTTGGGGGGGTKSYGYFTPIDNVPQTSDFATLDTRTSGVPVLDFDPTAVEAATFTGLLPEAAVTTNGLKIRIAWTADTVTNTDAVVWGIQFQRVDTSTDLDTDAFSNTVTATASASGTAGVPVITEITVTGTAALDSIVAGDFYRVRISRDGTHTSDALTADACLVACEIRDAT